MGIRHLLFSVVFGCFCGVTLQSTLTCPRESSRSLFNLCLLLSRCVNPINCILSQTSRQENMNFQRSGSIAVAHVCSKQYLSQLPRIPTAYRSQCSISQSKLQECKLDYLSTLCYCCPPRSPSPHPPATHPSILIFLEAFSRT